LRKKFEDVELKHNWHNIPATLSFGIGYYPAHGEDPREIIARADLACEFVQQRGGNGYAFAPEG
jgi:GGDEF domain-containing protein